MSQHSDRYRRYHNEPLPEEPPEQQDAGEVAHFEDGSGERFAEGDDSKVVEDDDVEEVVEDDDMEEVVEDDDTEEVVEDDADGNLERPALRKGSFARDGFPGVSAGQYSAARVPPENSAGLRHRGPGKHPTRQAMKVEKNATPQLEVRRSEQNRPTFHGYPEQAVDRHRDSRPLWDEGRRQVYNKTMHGSTPDENRPQRSGTISRELMVPRTEYGDEHPRYQPGSASSLGVLLKMAFAAGLLCALGIGSFLYSQKQYSKSPYTKLQSFAVSEIVNNDLKDIQDIIVDELKLYAQATCVEHSSAEAVRSALQIQLNTIPKEVRDEVVHGAVIEGMSTTNSIQNTTAGAAKDGKAFSYIAFWSTAFNGDHSYLAPRYTTCVMVAGVTLLIGEDVAEFKTSKQQRLLGTRRCECGLFRCGECPILEEVETKTPIFKRHKMTLRKQVELHRWMVKQAVDRASALVDTRAAMQKQMLNRPRDPGLSSLAWQPPDQTVFYGSDNTIGSNSEEQ